MERRGAAEVVAIDVDEPEELDFALDYRTAGPAYIREVRAERGPGFAEAKAALVRRSCVAIAPCTTWTLPRTGGSTS